MCGGGGGVRGVLKRIGKGEKERKGKRLHQNLGRDSCSPWGQREIQRSERRKMLKQNEIKLSQEFK